LGEVLAQNAQAINRILSGNEKFSRYSGASQWRVVSSMANNKYLPEETALFASKSQIARLEAHAERTTQWGRHFLKGSIVK